jgi:alpha-mannosidase
LAADHHEKLELELETKPQASWTAVHDGARGLAIVAPGQPESAVRDLPTRPIALTLFRGFYRTVAQENESGGQVLGSRTHRYLICPLRGPLNPRELTERAQLLAAGTACEYTDRQRRALLNKSPQWPTTGAFLDPGTGPCVVSACTAAKQGDGFIVRMFNPTDATTEQTLTFAADVQDAARVDLQENVSAALKADGPRVTVAVGSREIVTLRMKAALPA